MVDLSAKYMGFSLKNPLIAGSSGLTNSVGSIKQLEKQGIAAVVLKSLFEEELVCQIPSDKDSHYPYQKTKDYVAHQSKYSSIEEYIRLIEEAKKSVSIPVIASINCISAYEWTSFSKRIEAAGADALELNIFVMPSDPMMGSSDCEKVYFEVLTEVRRKIKIPIAVKISPYFSGMTKMAMKLSWTGINGLVLFNRFYSPDIDIETIKTVPGKLLSSPDEILNSLRWVALLSDRVLSDIAGSTGAHDAAGVIKYLLAGARAVQLTSTLYKNGFEQIGIILNDLSAWMERHHFETIPEFLGSLSLKKSEDPADYERFQYIKTIGPPDKAE
ncbi:MAG: dihydroorotate dehydrogenase-like protein [Bacteroidetes bacterium]|nr:dihydroorotate dehydrogenase-like protein [Bacteroidota bacterium]